MSHCILPKRLRQLISVAARGLETPADAHAIYFLLLAQSHPTPPSPSPSTWHLVCRSNTVPASPNPEWDPIFLADTNLPEHTFATSQILIITICCNYNEDRDKEVEHHHSSLTPSPPTTTSSLNNHIIYTNTKDTPTIQLDLQSLRSTDNNALHLLQTAIQPILLLPSATTSASSVVVNAAWKVNLPHLHYLGDDLGALPHQLPPNSIVLEYEDGYYTPALLLLLPLTSYDEDNKNNKGSESLSSGVKDIVGGVGIHQNNNNTMQQQRYSSPVKMKIKQVAAATAVDGSNSVNRTTEGEGEGEEVMVSTEDEVEEVEEGGSTYFEVKSQNNSNNTSNRGGGGSKILSLSQLQQSTLSLSALKERAADLRSVRDGKCRQLELLKSTSSKLKDQKAGLGALCQETQVLKFRSEALQQKKAALQQQVTVLEQTIAARAQALATTLKVAQAADKRVNDARLAVAGEAGCERLVHITRELVVRRCTLVCQVGKVMRLGLYSKGGGGEVHPTSSTNAVRKSRLSSSSSSTTQPASLTQVLEVGWAGAATPSITAGNPEYLKVDLADSTAATNDNNKMNQELHATTNIVSIERKTTSSTNNNHHPPPHPPTMAVLSIGGLKVLDPEILRRIFTEEYMSSDPEPDEDKALSVALGYVALLVDRLATYLEIPCRYPIQLKGSVSSIMDGWGSGGSWREEELVESRGLFSSWVGSGSGGGGGVQTVVPSQATRPHSGSGPITTTTTTNSNMVRRKEYPLHCFGGIRERGRFAIGVFLLNKNVVQLLQMHGIGGGGASQLLGNLYKLLVAAKSAV